MPAVFSNAGKASVPRGRVNASARSERAAVSSQRTMNGPGVLLLLTSGYKKRRRVHLTRLLWQAAEAAYSFSVKLIQPVGQFSTQVPQPVHFMGLTWARQWSMVMAPSGHTLLHLVQPMQPALHTSITALPRL